MTTSPVTTLTDELLAELELCESCDCGFDMDRTDVKTVLSELRRLRAENADMAKDAGRLEWMVTEGAVIARMNGTGRPMCYQVSFPFESCQQLDWFPSWREAVDDIMADQ